jgi:hypothetical protein
MLYINLVTFCLTAASSNTDKNYINLLIFRWKHHNICVYESNSSNLNLYLDINLILKRTNIYLLYLLFY